MKITRSNRGLPLSVDKKRMILFLREKRLSWETQFLNKFQWCRKKRMFFFFFENFQNKFYFAEFFHESLFEWNKHAPVWYLWICSDLPYGTNLMRTERTYVGIGQKVMFPIRIFMFSWHEVIICVLQFRRSADSGPNYSGFCSGSAVRPFFLDIFFWNFFLNDFWFLSYKFLFYILYSTGTFTYVYITVRPS